MASADTARTRPVRFLRWCLVILIALILLPCLLVLLYLVVRPVSTLMLWRWMTGARVERVWVPLEQMAPALPLAVIVAEDAKFCSHRGVDWAALREVMDDAEDGEVFLFGTAMASFSLDPSAPGART